MFKTSLTSQLRSVSALMWSNFHLLWCQVGRSGGSEDDAESKQPLLFSGHVLMLLSC